MRVGRVMLGGTNERPVRRALLMALLPLGQYDPAVLARLAGDLQAVLRADVSVGPPAALPAGAYEPRRGQYRAGELLRLVRARAPREADATLGVTEADMYSRNVNFVFGQADLGGRQGIISVHRLRRPYQGAPPDEARLARRVLTEAMHELGHMLGAEHCPNAHCVMFFSHNLPDTDRKGPLPCPRCRHFYPLADQPSP